MTQKRVNYSTDPGLINEPGASTPTAFTPKDPASEQPFGPPELVKIVKRIFSTARETPNLAQCAPALTSGSSITEEMPTQKETLESKPSKRPPNREATAPAKELVTPKDRAHIHDVECCGPGDWEKPNPSNTYIPSLLNDNTGLSSRQLPSPSPVRAADRSTPPDEEQIRNASWKPQDGPASQCEYVSPPPPIVNIAITIARCVQETMDQAQPSHAPMVATQNTTNSPLQHRAETEGAPKQSPQPMVPGETHGHTATCTPVNMQQIALTKIRIIIDQLTGQLLSTIKYIQRINQQYNTSVQHIITATNHKVQQTSIYIPLIRNHPTIDDTLDAKIAKPLIECVDQHYHQIYEEQYNKMFTNTQQTYLHILSENQLTPIKHLAEKILLDSLENFANYIRFKFKNDHHSNPIMATPPPTRTNNKQTDHTISTHHHTSPNVLENDPTETQAHNHSTPSPINTENNTTNNTTRSGKSHKQRIKYKKEHTVENCLNPHCFTCAKNNIINLSDSTLTRNQILLLNKGLSFVPTAKNAPAHEILRDFNTITNKTKRKLKRLINPPRTPRPNDEPTLIRKTEQFNDNTNTQNLGPKPLEDAFLAMKNEIANIKETHTTKYNLTRGERLALTQLSSNHDLIINKADKGFTIVVRNRDEYIKAGLEHLSDKNTYISLERNYTNDVTHIITNTLKDLCTRGLISPNMKEYCLPPKSPRTALIYFLAKIHENPIGIRPIVSTVNSATANLAECLYFYLQPIMKSLPAYLKDTGQFLEEISNIQVHKNTWLITVDVKSLYTNIPNDEGIQACYEAWRRQELTDPQHPPAETLRHLLELVLKLNTFEFNEKYYLQIFGTAMGSKLAPAYANTFMGRLEVAILDSSPTKPTYYRRFIDDIFMIWPHSEEELDKFITHMNNQNKSIQFTYEKNLTKITFLDVIVSKQNDQTDTDSPIKLSTRTHIKNTNKQLYVKNESYHPPGTGKGIIIGEAIRYLRTNSNSNSFHKMIHKHKRNLAKRGYNKNKINNILSNIKFSDRHKYKVTRNKKPNNQVL